MDQRTIHNSQTTKNRGQKMKQKCKYDNCDSTNLKTSKTPEQVHYAKQECRKCGRLQKWISNPNSKDHKKRNTDIEEVLKQRGFDKEFCFWCSRTRDELGTNETLEVDHIKEISEGGEDKPRNCRVVCTKCHKQRNHDKLYIKKHLQKFYRGANQ